MSEMNSCTSLPVEIPISTNIDQITKFKLSTTDFVIPSEKETLKIMITLITEIDHLIRITCDSFFCEMKNPTWSGGLVTQYENLKMKPNETVVVEIGMRDLQENSLSKIIADDETKNPEGVISIVSYENEWALQDHDTPDRFINKLKLSWDSEEIKNWKKKYKNTCSAKRTEKFKKMEEEKKIEKEKMKMKEEAEKKMKKKKKCVIM